MTENKNPSPGDIRGAVQIGTLANWVLIADGTQDCVEIYTGFEWVKVPDMTPAFTLKKDALRKALKHLIAADHHSFESPKYKEAIKEAMSYLESPPFKALVHPNLMVQDMGGFGLRFVQSVFNSPIRHPHCWAAWEATEFKHTPEETLPNVPVVVWFSATNSSTQNQNWGQAAVWVPAEQAFLSNPAQPSRFGQVWFESIRDIEMAFDAHYVGWSEDINGLRVASR